MHSAANPITLKTLRGHIEVAPALDDCSHCVGKVFVAKSIAGPDGKTEAETVKQEHLPATLCVIKTSDGMANLESDPNRRTLIVYDDGRIVTAVRD